MFKTLRNAWSVPEIRKKLLYTLLMILIFRMGCAVVVPFLDTSMVTSWMDEKATGGNFLEYLDIITGGALSQATGEEVRNLHDSEMREFPEAIHLLCITASGCCGDTHL